MRRIILDTDFLLSAVRFRVDIFLELKRVCDFNYRVCILDKGLKELNGKKGEKMVLELLKSAPEEVEVIKTTGKGNVDEALLGMNGENGDFAVATQDKELKENLKKKKIPVITIRQKKYLIMV